MLRWAKVRSAVGGAVVDARELGYTSFALTLQYHGPESRGWFADVLELLRPRGQYRLLARITLKNDRVADVIKRHELGEAIAFIDEPAHKAAKERLAQIDEDWERYFNASTFPFAVAPLLAWLFTRRVGAGLQDTAVVRITLSRLIDGVGIAGTMPEIRHVAFELAGSLDRMSNQIAAGIDFDEQAIVVMAPGSKLKPKKDKSGTSPGNWSV